MRILMPIIFIAFGCYINLLAQKFGRFPVESGSYTMVDSLGHGMVINSIVFFKGYGARINMQIQGSGKTKIIIFMNNHAYHLHLHTRTYVVDEQLYNLQLGDPGDPIQFTVKKDAFRDWKLLGEEEVAGKLCKIYYFKDDNIEKTSWVWENIVFKSLSISRNDYPAQNRSSSSILSFDDNPPRENYFEIPKGFKDEE